MHGVSPGEAVAGIPGAGIVFDVPAEHFNCVVEPLPPEKFIAGLVDEAFLNPGEGRSPCESGYAVSQNALLDTELRRAPGGAFRHVLAPCGRGGGEMSAE